MLNKLIVDYNKKSRGIDGVQCLPDQGSRNIKKLYDFLLYKDEKYSNVGRLIPFDFELNINLKPKAKFTDFMLLGHLRTSFGLLLSEHALSILEKYNISPYQKYNVKINNSDHKYYWIYFIRLIECIDFSKTYYYSNGKLPYHDENTFIDVRKSYDSKIRQIEIDYPFNNEEKQEAIIELNNSTDAKTIFLKDNWNKNLYDLACFKYDTNIFISDQLKNKLIDSNLKGFEIEELIKTDSKINIDDLQSPTI